MNKEKILENEQLIPVSIFKKPRLSPFEAIVKYLKEEEQLTYRQIGKLLNRDERNIWTVYNRVKKKLR